MSFVDIVFDIGGTNTRVAQVFEGELGEPHIFHTGTHPEAGLRVLTDEIKTIAKDFKVRAICGDMAGIVKEGTIHVSPNLPDWNGTDIVGHLSREFLGTTITFFNDAELVALGEYYYGAGKNEKNMLYVTVSTGVGGVHIKNGTVNRGQYNAEMGHQIIDGGFELEQLVSGTAVQKKYGIQPKDLTDAPALSELAEFLARGLYNTTLHWSPEVIVLGGSMIVGKNGIPVERVSETLGALVTQYYPTAPDVRRALLGDSGGLYGGLAYLTRSA